MVKRRNTDVENTVNKKVKRDTANGNGKGDDDQFEQPFTIVKETHTDYFTGAKSVRVYVRFHNAELIDIMRKCFNDSEFYNDPPKILIDNLLYKVPVLRKLCGDKDSETGERV